MDRGEGRAMSTESIEQEIHALEEQRDQALLLADNDALTPLLADGLVYTYWSGRSDSKTAYLEGVKSGSLSTARSSVQMNAYRCMTASPWLLDAHTSKWSWAA